MPSELLERYGHLPMPQWQEVQAYYLLKEEDERRRRGNKEMEDVVDGDGEDGEGRPSFGGRVNE